MGKYLIKANYRTPGGRQGTCSKVISADSDSAAMVKLCHALTARGCSKIDTISYGEKHHEK